MINELLGKVITRIDGTKDDDRLVFTLDDGTQYEMCHIQDCCEDVVIEDIVGNMEDLLNSPVTMAEEETNSDNPKEDSYDESFTWTFYKLATVKGYVTIRWYGQSNGYYSESVEFYKIDFNQ